MKKIAVAIIFSFLAIAARPQGMAISSTFSTSSTEGNFFGTWSFSFSTNSFTPAGGGQPPTVGQWGIASTSMTFTDAASGSIISLYFSVGGIESPNEFGVRSTINVTDPAFGTVIGGLGDAGGDGYQENTTLIYPGHSTSLTNFNNQDTFHYYSPKTGSGGQGNVNRNDNLNFNGILGGGGGTWYISYPVPEPSITWQAAVGGALLCLARFVHRRRL